jgi:hypothetical protein
VEDGGVEELHRFQGIGEVRRLLAQVLVEAPVAFLPKMDASVTVLTLETGKVVAIDYAKDEAALERLLALRMK